MKVTVMFETKGSFFYDNRSFLKKAQNSKMTCCRKKMNLLFQTYDRKFHFMGCLGCDNGKFKFQYKILYFHAKYKK